MIRPDVLVRLEFASAASHVLVFTADIAAILLERKALVEALESLQAAAHCLEDAADNFVMAYENGGEEMVPMRPYAVAFAAATREYDQIRRAAAVLGGGETK